MSIKRTLIKNILPGMLAHSPAGMQQTGMRGEKAFKHVAIGLLLSVLCGQAHAQSPKLENLGKKVNSHASELVPMISMDGRTLYFVRDGHEKNKAKQDIWYCTREADSTWSEAIHPGYPLNQGKNATVMYISTDNNQLMIRGAYVDGEFESSGISIVNKNKRGEWKDPVKMEIKNFTKYSSMGRYNGACITPDGKTLIYYFTNSSNNERGDLYFSHLIQKEKFNKDASFKEMGKFLGKALKNNTWTEPTKITSLSLDEYDDVAAFMAADGVTMYFSSNRPGGEGSNDIWMTKRLDDTWQNWSEPVNLGPDVNTTGWDSYYVLDAKAEFAYMVSDKDSYGRGDIVKIKLKEDVKPNPVVLVSGKVYDTKTKLPIEARIEYENLTDGKNMGVATSDPKTGEYKIVLPYGINYGFLAGVEGYIAVSDNLDLSTVSSYKEIQRDLALVPLEKGSVIRLNNIFFEFGKATLKPESYPELDRLLELMAVNKKLEIELSGHTDNVGSDAANMELSQNRANAVKEYLLAKGVPAERVSSKGYGETKPVASNDTEEGKQLNRRVEFTILKN